MIRVVIADDQALVRGGFRSILEGQQDLDIVGEAEDGLQAVELVKETRPDVVLMDIRMPRLDGIAATAAISSGPGHHPRVLILTTFDHDEYVYQALRVGASGFLLKTAPPRQLADAIRTVASGDALLAPQITRRLIEQYVSRARPSGTAERLLGGLTPREREVLTLVAGGSTNREIASQLYLSEPTVKTHIGRIFSKIGARDRVSAVVIAYEAGLVQPGGRVSPVGSLVVGCVDAPGGVEGSRGVPSTGGGFDLRVPRPGRRDGEGDATQVG